MKIHVLETPASASIFVARILAAQVQKKNGSVLGLATGGTMPPVYEELLSIARKQRISLTDISTFNLDEYIGLSPEHPQSYSRFMRHHLFDRIDCDRSRLAVPRGDSRDPDAEAQRYEAAIKQSGGIDLQLLGLGANGHIGFNEPGASFSSRTRVETLSEDTRLANARFFAHGEIVPSEAITMGIGTILEARSIVLLAAGESKAPAVRAMIEGPITPDCPASVLQKHPNVAVVLDAAAAALLSPSESITHHGVTPAQPEPTNAS